uniref:C-type lectin domain-containing protein n=1 Tax=Sinocyclocheilus anshuiensis TaxID=1608454 RepID=A0A671LAX5_9TELE
WWSVAAMFFGQEASSRKSPGCFKLLPLKVTGTTCWPEAQSYCRAKHTDLAFVDSMADASRLINIVDAGYSGSVWIGLKRVTQKRWGWSKGEDTLAQYSAWNAGEPNNQNECAFLSYGVWHTYQCSSVIHFVCYSGERLSMTGSRGISLEHNKYNKG